MFLALTTVHNVPKIKFYFTINVCAKILLFKITKNNASLAAKIVSPATNSRNAPLVTLI